MQYIYYCKVPPTTNAKMELEHTGFESKLTPESIAHCHRPFAYSSHMGISQAACKQTSGDFECFALTSKNEMSDDDDVCFFEVFDNLGCARCRSQDDCLNSFSRSNLFEPWMQSERARYNFQTGLTNTRDELLRSKAAATGSLRLRFSTSTHCE